MSTERLTNLPKVTQLRVTEPGFEPCESGSRGPAVNYHTTHTLERWSLSVQCDEVIVAGRTDNIGAWREDWRVLAHGESSGQLELFPLKYIF